MSTWKVSEKFDSQLNGYAITQDGRLVAVAVYSGGTEPARENAELIVTMLNEVADLREKAWKYDELCK